MGCMKSQPGHRIKKPPLLNTDNPTQKHLRSRGSEFLFQYHRFSFLNNKSNKSRLMMSN